MSLLNDSLFDVTILTDHRYVAPTSTDDYTSNVVLEDQFVKEALENRGYKVARTNWDNPDFDWTQTRYIVFRTTWDYFERFDEFSKWLEEVSTKTKLINQKELIYWNIDKHYLQDLESKGITIPASIFIEKGDPRSLSEIVETTNWKEVILKPTISGAARHTYRFNSNESSDFDSIHSDLIANESMILQEYQHQITSKGEVAYMVFGGKYSHAILKKAKAGDFRVQDDFGGTIHHYKPNEVEIEFVEKAFAAIDPIPVYARVDVIWDNEDNLAIGEIELIEPELWFRMDDNAAEAMADAIINYIS
jgi:glutathione synthase/RimK-type ligase-like ATP-grasp enzyme